MNKLILDAQQGDEKSFNLLFKEYYKDVYLTVFLIVKDEDIAKDLVSDVFIKIYQKLSSYKEDISFRMWVKTIANNHCIDYLRKVKRTAEVNLDDFQMDSNHYTENNALSEMIDNENLKTMYSSINKLKEPYKSIIKMRLDGKQYKEISKELNINMGTLKAYINFAKRKLQKFAKKHE